jgi:chromosome segregation ATPase
MTTLEERMGLEAQVQTLGLELGKTKDLVRQSSRRLLDTKTSIAKIEEVIQTLEAGLRYLKRDAKVVLLSEYEITLVLIANNKELLAKKKLEIPRLKTQGLEAQQRIPGLEAQVKRLEKKLTTYGKVLQFQR